jgi:hypothetical protein
MPSRTAADALATRLAAEGRVFYGSDADQNDTVTGQTSFANTTPTFMIRHDSTNTVVLVPLYISLNQTGTVAGDAVQIIVEIDNAARWSSGGTVETVLSSRPLKGKTNQCILYSNPTAGSGYGVRVDGITTGQDVSPAEGALQQYLWTPTSTMDILDPGSNLLVYTYAGTTGPTWFWTFKWAEIPVDQAASYFGYANP